MRLAVLGSGSGGNAAYLEANGVRVLIDAGFSCRDLEARLTALGADPARVDAIFLSHEHGDHTRGAARFAAKFGSTVVATRGTLRAAGLAAGPGKRCAFDGGDAFCFKGLRVATAPIPHDAVDPVAFRVEAEEGSVGVALDLGHAPVPVCNLLAGCELLLLESNHDPELLERGPYPQELKKRLRGPRGHLSNEDAASLLSQVAGSTTRSLVLAHLSRTNNRADLALGAALHALESIAPRVTVKVAEQSRVSPWIEV